MTLGGSDAERAFLATRLPVASVTLCLLSESSEYGRIRVTLNARSFVAVITGQSLDASLLVLGGRNLLRSVRQECLLETNKTVNLIRFARVRTRSNRFRNVCSRSTRYEGRFVFFLPEARRNSFWCLYRDTLGLYVYVSASSTRRVLSVRERGGV